MIETIGLARLRPVRQASLTAFGALVLRDLVVLKKGLGAFIIRTIMQPLLFVFVFTYVFPKIGQGIGGSSGAARFSSLLVPGVVAIACIFQGIQAVALPLVQEFSYTREIEDRVMAPLPVWAVALEKITAGALQGVVAGVIVFPLALVIPTTTVHLSVQWPELITFLPLSAILGASLGLAIGTRVKPQQVPLLFSIIVLPITFLGATYYPWATLTPIAWLKVVVLVNPLVYMSEAFRTALTPQIPHMPTAVIYLALIGFAAALGWLGIDGFKRRVLA
ncbi:MAG: ABC transporter permease [Actinomycetota bacterium]|nr:ABC transporter permease [Actinomycetota bacterium]